MTRTLTVATYNVHGFRAHFGRPDPRRTADVVRSLDADVVALQEMTGLGVDPGPRSLRVLDVLPEYDGVVAPTRAGGGGFGNALLTRHPVRSADCVDLSRRRREPRSALDVRLDVGGVELRVVSTHLGLRHAERRRQVERLLAHVDAEPSPFLIVLGDFNDWLPGAPAVRRLEERFGVSPRVASYPAWKPFLALDRIWVHPGSALREVSVRDTRLARRASDHLPVVARVTCPEAVDDPAGTHEKMAAGRR